MAESDCEQGTRDGHCPLGRAVQENRGEYLSFPSRQGVRPIVHF